MSGNYFLKTDLTLASGNSFSSYWKPFSFLVSDTFQGVLHPSQWKHIFQSRRNSIVFYLELFFLLVETIREAYLKLLSLLLATTFFDFLDIHANVSSFFVQQERILKQILRSCQWKPIFCLLETVFFYLEIFSASGTIGEIQILKNNFIPVC